mgnify:CR=1
MHYILYYSCIHTIKCSALEKIPFVLAHSLGSFVFSSCEVYLVGFASKECKISLFRVEVLDIDMDKGRRMHMNKDMIRTTPIEN